MTRPRGDGRARPGAPRGGADDRPGTGTDGDGEREHQGAEGDRERRQHDRPREADLVERHRHRDRHHEDVHGLADEPCRRPARVHRGQEYDAPDHVGEHEPQGQDRDGADEARHKAKHLGPQGRQRAEAEGVEPRQEKSEEEQPEHRRGHDALGRGQLGLAQQLRRPGPLREAAQSQPAEGTQGHRAGESRDEPTGHDHAEHGEQARDHEPQALDVSAPGLAQGE